MWTLGDFYSAATLLSVWFTGNHLINDTIF